MRDRLPVWRHHARQIHQDRFRRIRMENLVVGREGQLASVYTLAWWHTPKTPVRKPEEVPKSTRTNEDVELRLEKLGEKIQMAIDIGLENRKLLEQLLEEESRIGLGAIHSLDQGRVQLIHPLIYNYQVLEDEVVAGIEELRVYGVGATESEAVRELQEELWSLIQDLEQTQSEKLGTHLQNTLETLKWRMRRSAVDA